MTPPATHCVVNICIGRKALEVCVGIPLIRDNDIVDSFAAVDSAGADDAQLSRYRRRCETGRRKHGENRDDHPFADFVLQGVEQSLGLILCCKCSLRRVEQAITQKVNKKRRHPCPCRARKGITSWL